MELNAKIASLVLLLALPTGAVVYTQLEPSRTGVVQHCQFTTQTFDGDAVVLAGVGQVDRGDTTEYLVNVTVTTDEIDRLVLTTNGTTVVNRSVSPGNYSFDLTESEVRSVNVAATSDNGTVLDRASVEYRCSETTPVSATADLRVRPDESGIRVSPA